MIAAISVAVMSAIMNPSMPAPVLHVRLRPEANVLSFSNPEGLGGTNLAMLMENLNATLKFCQLSRKDFVMNIAGLPARISVLLLINRVREHVAHDLRRLVLVGVNRDWEQLFREHGLLEQLEIAADERAAFNRVDNGPW